MFFAAGDYFRNYQAANFTRMNRFFLPISLFFMLFSPRIFAQNLPVLHADSNMISYRIDDVFYKQTWRIVPEAKPDVLEVPVKDKPVQVDFISGTDSLSFTAEAGRTYDFIVLQKGRSDTAYTRIRAYQYVKPAVFSKAYAKQNEGKTSVEIRPVYELINIVYALTPSAEQDEDIVYRNTAYHTAVLNWFGKYKTHPVVARIDSALRKDMYFILKMDAYAFDWKNRRIRQNAVFDHVAWRDTNTLRPYVAALEDFARKSDFDRFYRTQQFVYDAQVRCYRDSIQTPRMLGWLRRNFPKTDYNAFRVIFSPLVSGNQSANWIEDNGFREAHAHVNFPYVQPETRKKWSENSLQFVRGEIVFTELNHAFINPETDRHADKAAFVQAFKNLNFWIDKEKPAGNYNDPLSCFNEYMNWALVSLYAVDVAPSEEFDGIADGISDMMTQRRGFREFAAFQPFLIKAYRERKKGQTVADLYPQIIGWFADRSPQKED